MKLQFDVRLETFVKRDKTYTEDWTPVPPTGEEVEKLRSEAVKELRQHAAKLLILDAPHTEVTQKQVQQHSDKIEYYVFEQTYRLNEMPDNHPSTPVLPLEIRLELLEWHEHDIGIWDDCAAGREGQYCCVDHLTQVQERIE